VRRVLFYTPAAVLAPANESRLHGPTPAYLPVVLDAGAAAL